MSHMKKHKTIQWQAIWLPGIMIYSATATCSLVLDKWTKIMDEGGVIDCIYCDFKKAFDKVPNRRLINEVES